MKLPKPYFFMLFSAFLVACFHLGYYFCNYTKYCNIAGGSFYKLGEIGLFIIPLGALYQLGIAAVQNLKNNPLYKPNALSGAACLVLWIFLIGSAVKQNPPDQENIDIIAPTSNSVTQ